MARATFSSLKGHKSSMDPPPRPTRITSHPPWRFSASRAATISPAAAAPWTWAGHSRMSTPGSRRRATRTMSRRAAPVGEVTMPTRRGSRGSGRFRAGSKSPSRLNFSFSASKRKNSSPAPSRRIPWQYSWKAPLATYREAEPLTTTICPSRGSKSRAMAFCRNMTHCTRAFSSLMAKYRCPLVWRLKPLSSPRTRTARSSGSPARCRRTYSPSCSTDSTQSSFMALSPRP